MVGSGMMNTPERLKELSERRDRHERLTSGTPAKTFKEVFEEKMKKVSRKNDDEEKERDKDEGEEQGEEEHKDGAIDPLLGLSPGQKPSLANPSKDRRSSKFIVKG